MTSLSPALESALSADRPLIYGSVEINLPGYDLRVLDGSGVLTVGGRTFVGEDPIYGVLDSIDDLTDGYGDEAPAISIKFLPANGAAAGQLSSPTFQGSRVRVRLGAIDRTTGLSIDETLLFDGELDVPVLTAGMRERSLELECVSSFERFFEQDEGARLCDAFHQSIWPGETGMANTTGLETTLTWGAPTPTT